MQKRLYASSRGLNMRLLQMAAARSGPNDSAGICFLQQLSRMSAAQRLQSITHAAQRASNASPNPCQPAARRGTPGHLAERVFP